jgi:hypothetical protein
VLPELLLSPNSCFIERRNGARLETHESIDRE